MAFKKKNLYEDKIATAILSNFLFIAFETKLLKKYFF